MRRPSTYVPLSVTFATDKTGETIQHKYGIEGLGVWAAMIAAAKRGRGSITFAHESDWQAIGILSPPSFLLKDLLKTTGRIHQTRSRQHGRVIYADLTHYSDWNDDAHKGFERERKASKPGNSKRKTAGSKPEVNRKVCAPDLEVERDKSSKQRVVADDLPQPLAAGPRRLLERLISRSQERKAS